MSLTIEGVSKRFTTKTKKSLILDNINISFKDGEFICLLGPSGCGKSTLLNIIAGLEQPTSGKVFLDSNEIKNVGVDRAMMFQDSALFPWLKVIDNVEFGMKIAGVPKEERRDKAMKYLRMVHLTKFKNSYIHELSGGMRQRVALARALTLDSKVLLMDEPFSALDSQTKSILQLQLQKVWMQTKKTIVFVTHNVEEAVLLADRVVVMAANPGKIKREFSIKLARPRTIENIDLSYVVAEVMKDLKEEVEKVARSEYDSDWSIEESGLLHNPDNNMGNGI
ncbi:ATP-binding cassette domain-containing protein [Clostridium tyrobutyricum]|uniref:ABC-type quaternary amine transporter n=2 Tax=Clostridium tyrobutyricum TaxID=1519 RepID=W6N8A5_CLOTY|nr:ABC transporter ATP-binding protein [Clostridium tyrobutyricum]AND84550.1 sulfate ABC transporter ATPase [Clostridium tyrobutyricum]ANP69162.1 nitrate/sulfonate/bicarbonate ABC transporter ATP-binding protein [Clostridium tyrobutyricum]MBV4419436.1 ABC transporter ATP-binding protein [Clostridium tyrobutyricum]MBV4425010.1 ABC transporter ATP-binding protein [Clostridium tyrobutyricum]MBV4427279.1 ABC transporter ATP-binding protein [Clostridium tyrobutyricum]